MKQQINLYQPMFRTPKRVFSALALLQVCGLVLGGLLATYTYSAWQVKTLARQVGHLSNTRTAALARVDSLRQQFPVRTPDPLLKAELQRLQLETAYTQEVATALSSGAFGNTTGLSAYLAALARQHVDGTWLTRVDIARGGGAIGVQGQAASPELIPVYVRRLANESAFVGKTFSKLELTTPSEAHGAVQFSIKTEGLSSGDNDPAGHGKS